MKTFNIETIACSHSSLCAYMIRLSEHREHTPLKKTYNLMVNSLEELTSGDLAILNKVEHFFVHSQI